MLKAMLEGFQYAFFVNRQMRDDAAPRAGLVQFQSYPRNSVQGGGTLVGAQINNAGKYWGITCHPQVIQQNKPIVSSLLAGGTMSGTVAMQPLIDTSQAQG